MKLSEKLHQLGIDPKTADFSTILDAIGEEDSLVKSKDQVSADLVSLMAFTDMSRTNLSEKLGYKKSRITRILSGMENLTLRTIHDVSKALGYEFDVTFRKKLDVRPLQPWQSIEINFDNPVYKTTSTVFTSGLSVNSMTQSSANDSTWGFKSRLELIAA